MIAVIDCSSLLSLARYYLPNDKKNKLYEFLKKKIENGEILVIDKVLEEARFVSQKLVVQRLDFLNDKEFCKKNQVGEKTEDLIPFAHERFYRMVDNSFAVRALTNRLSSAEYEVEKKLFLNSADIKMIVKCHNFKNADIEAVLITEETNRANDRKYFKKIPAICDFLNIRTLNIQEFLELQNELVIEIN
ncbi:DUF4411 family protein [Chryseobacterium sp. R2A-55]|uniref:DUF4411 family protein n=1 Tax=Chryseobacterium sp. R2A-55 TaxID=2744445 RepID=UPI001F3234C2|nr:DUF4411 family protein [Chryseobacterium sp. R2A-55]